MESTVLSAAVLLEARSLTKSYDGLAAVRGVDLDVRVGEVHALVGENGAGKSTLVRILGGLVRPDSGEIRIYDVPVRFRDPHDALRNGIAVIHQELLLFPDLTVAENVCMGREPTNRFGGLRRGAMEEEARTLLGRVGVSMDPRRRMRNSSVAEMQTVEIAKALGYRSRLIVMDEPTSALSGREADRLLGLIVDLKRTGVSIVYISHRMEEIFRVADRITVLRDGSVVAVHAASYVSESALVAEMVGREIGTVFPTTASPQPEPVLDFRDAAGAKFTVHKGEVVGFAGLMGAGRTELVTEIARSGRGRIAMVTEDRKGSGIIPEMSVAQNITLAALKKMCRGPFVDRHAEAAAAAQQIGRLSIRCASPAQKIARLSGGNQQKALLGRAMLTDPDVLILDEPTRGVDVAAKSEIYGIITERARSGTAILLVSSELPELLALSHRILVMRASRVCAELNPEQTTAEEVLSRAMPQ